MEKPNKWVIAVNIFHKIEDDLHIAHCLELDIVATGTSKEEADKDIKDLIAAQVDYCFSNGNLESLYHPAPPEVWKEFLATREETEELYQIESQVVHRPPDIPPPWILAKMREAESLEYV
jgi:hypothetical protein